MRFYSKIFWSHSPANTNIERQRNRFDSIFPFFIVSYICRRKTAYMWNSAHTCRRMRLQNCRNRTSAVISFVLLVNIFHCIDYLNCYTKTFSYLFMKTLVSCMKHCAIFNMRTKALCESWVMFKLIFKRVFTIQYIKRDKIRVEDTFNFFFYSKIFCERV